MMKESKQQTYEWNMILDKNGQRPFRLLIYYYGALQTIHLLLLIQAGLNYLETQTIGFLALPPITGWTQQGKWFLLAMGYTDALIAIVSMVFVFGFMKNKQWFIRVGLIALSGTIATTIWFRNGCLRCLDSP